MLYLVLTEEQRQKIYEAEIEAISMPGTAQSIDPIDEDTAELKRFHFWVRDRRTMDAEMDYVFASRADEAEQKAVNSCLGTHWDFIEMDPNE